MEITPEITPEITSESTPEITPKRKSGRRKGSIIPNAICRNPELQIIQKQRLAATYKQSKCYILAKINTLTHKYNLNITFTNNETTEELNLLLNNIKINNLIERANLLKIKHKCLGIV